MGLWGMFPQKPLWWSILGALSDDKKEESKSNNSSRSSYTYDDDDDYDWEKEERKRARKSLQSQSKRFLQEKSVEVIDVLSQAKLCTKKSYQPTLKLKRLKSDYLDMNFSRCFNAHSIGISVGRSIGRSVAGGAVYGALNALTEQNTTPDTTPLSDIQIIETISKDGYTKLSNIGLWFELTYDDKLDWHSQFKSDLSTLEKINDARHSIQKLLDKGL